MSRFRLCRWCHLAMDVSSWVFCIRGCPFNQQSMTLGDIGFVLAPLRMETPYCLLVSCCAQHSSGVFFFKTIVSCRELWLWGETVGTWVAALKMAVNGVFEDFYVLLKCVFIRNEGVLQNIFPNVLICVLEPLLAGPPYSPFIYWIWGSRGWYIAYLS